MFNVSVKRETVYDLVITGAESGSYSSFQVRGKWREAWKRAEAGERNPFRGIVIVDRHAESDEDAAGPPTRLTDAALAKGLQVLAEKVPKAMGDVFRDDCDALVGDAFLQCVAFGDVVYG